MRTTRIVELDLAKPQPATRGLYTTSIAFAATIWRVMRKFSSTINQAASTKTKITKDMLLDAMASVMYRLLHAKFRPGSLDEAVRVGLLAFGSSVFLQWKQTKLPDVLFPLEYKACMLQSQLLDASPQLWLWLLMMGAMAAMGKADHRWVYPLMRVNIEACGIESWTEAREMMKSLLWIGLVQDHVGQEIFEAALGSDGGGVASREPSQAGQACVLLGTTW